MAQAAYRLLHVILRVEHGISCTASVRLYIAYIAKLKGVEQLTIRLQLHTPRLTTILDVAIQYSSLSSLNVDNATSILTRSFPLLFNMMTFLPLSV